MNELILALVAAVALRTMVWKNTFRAFPAPSRLLAIGFGILIVTRLLGWLTITYLSRTLTADTFGTASYLTSLATTATLVVAIAFMIAAVFAARHPKDIVNTMQS